MSLSTQALAIFDADREGALELLLGAWRETRAPEIADLIDVVSDDITRTLPPIDGKTRRAFQEKWLDVANEGRAIDVGRLVATFSREPCTNMLERLSRFEAREHDPRVAAELTRLVGRCPCTSNPNFPMWTRIWAHLNAIGDSRMRRPLLAKLATTTKSQWGATSFEGVHFPRIEKALAALVEPPPLDDEDAVAVRALDARARKALAAPPVALPPRKKIAVTSVRTEDELVALVRADPGADGPRLVYSDWLLEHGDPRGEFIALQFKKDRSKAETKRMALLLSKNRPRWLDRLEVVIARGHDVFERGFLARCRTTFRTPHQIATLVNDPGWSTVVEVTLPPFELVVSPAMRALESVIGIGTTDAARLAEHGAPLRFTHVTLVVPVALDDRETPAIARGRALTSLTSLELVLPPHHDIAAPAVVPDDFDWLLEGELVTRLRTLKLTGHAGRALENPRPDLGAWLGAVHSLPNLTELAFDVQFGWQLKLVRDGERWALELGAYDPTETGTLEPVFRNVPHGTFSRVEAPSGAGADLRKILAPFTVR